MNAPPILLPPPKKNDTLLRNVLIAAGVVCSVILVAGFYLGFRIFQTAFREFESERGQKQVVRRQLDDGWKLVQLSELGWTIELPANAYRKDYDPKETNPDYMFFEFANRSLEGYISVDKEPEAIEWSPEAILAVDRGTFEDEKWELLDSSVKSLPMKLGIAYVVKLRFRDEHGTHASSTIYWMASDQLNSICFSYAAEDEKRNDAAFERTWKSLNPAVREANGKAPTRSPSG